MSVRTHPRILLKQRVHAQPLGGSRVEVTGSVIVETRLFIEFLGIEQVWRIPVAVSLFHEDLAKRNIHHILGDAPVHIGDHGSAAKVIGMIIEDA